MIEEFIAMLSDGELIQCLVEITEEIETRLMSKEEEG